MSMSDDKIRDYRRMFLPSDTGAAVCDEALERGREIERLREQACRWDARLYEHIRILEQELRAQMQARGLTETAINTAMFNAGAIAAQRTGWGVSIDPVESTASEPDPACDVGGDERMESVSDLKRAYDRHMAAFGPSAGTEQPRTDLASLRVDDLEQRVRKLEEPDATQQLQDEVDRMGDDESATERDIKAIYGRLDGVCARLEQVEQTVSSREGCLGKLVASSASLTNRVDHLERRLLDLLEGRSE